MQPVACALSIPGIHHSSFLKQRFRGLCALIIPVTAGVCAANRMDKGRKLMFLILAVVLMVLWLGLFLGLHLTSFLIHLLVVFAVISVIMHFVSGTRNTV